MKPINAGRLVLSNRHLRGERSTKATAINPRQELRWRVPLLSHTRRSRNSSRSRGVMGKRGETLRINYFGGQEALDQGFELAKRRP